MTDGPGREAAAMTGVAALPRRNGEIVFDAPWQGRALGLALALTASTGTGWEAFRSRLVAAIAADPDRPYWESWVAALECLAGEVLAGPPTG